MTKFDLSRRLDTLSIYIYPTVLRFECTYDSDAFIYPKFYIIKCIIIIFYFTYSNGKSLLGDSYHCKTCGSIYILPFPMFTIVVILKMICHVLHRKTGA